MQICGYNVDDVTDVFYNNIINSYKKPNNWAWAGWIFHVVVWVVSLILVGVNSATAVAKLEYNFTKTICVLDANGDCEYIDTFEMNNVTSATGALAPLAPVTLSLAIVLILLSGLRFGCHTDFPRWMSWVIMPAIFGLASFSGMSTLFITCKFAAFVDSTQHDHLNTKPNEADVTLGMFASLFVMFSAMLLYAHACNVGEDQEKRIMALPRTLICSVGYSIQLISAIAISSGDFVPEATKVQREIAWAVPFMILACLLIMGGLRVFAEQEKKAGGGDITTAVKEKPLLRSVLLFLFAGSAYLAAYKLSFVKSDADPVSFMFAIVGAFTNFIILAVAFTPDGNVSGGRHGENQPLAQP